MLIVTDGQENASKEYDLAAVRAVIEQKEKDGWNFAYMGANQDSYAVGGAMRFRPGFIANFDWTPEGAAANFRRMAGSSSRFRAARARGQAATFFDPSVQQATPEAGTGQVKPKPSAQRGAPPTPSNPPKPPTQPKRGVFHWLKHFFMDKPNAA
ncbi:MAG TPA: hypothetical protein VFY29_19515 [Terriglobia bacterium]|nr:hypothetical protein [Terriglobia bacterium]